MVGDFDKAFLDKVKKVWPNTIYANTAVTYNAVYSGGSGDLTEGKMKFPLMNIYRPSGFELAQPQTIGARLQGALSESTVPGTNQLVSVRYNLVKFIYQINIFSKSLTELDDMVNDLLVFFTLEPMLEVTQYSKDKKYAFTEKYELTYNNGPIDQSTFENDDRIYTYAIAYEIPAAKIVNFVPINRVEEVLIDVEVESEPTTTFKVEKNYRNKD